MNPTKNSVHLGGEVPVECNPDSKFLLQEETSLTDSIVWSFLKNYYKKMAIEAWSFNHVPMFISCNSRFARLYAMTVFNFMKDYYKSYSESSNGPIYILEVGAGHGRFSFLFLRHLLRTKNLWKMNNFPEVPFQYIMSDLAEANVKFCSDHRALQEFITGGWLDFCLFDANIEDGSLLTLKTINQKEIPKNKPIVLIANYVMDSLLTDSILFSSRQNYSFSSTSRAYMSVYSTQKESNLDDPTIISRISLKWKWIPFQMDFCDQKSANITSSTEEYTLEPKYIDYGVDYDQFIAKKRQSAILYNPYGVDLSNESYSNNISCQLTPEYIQNNSHIRTVLNSYKNMIDKNQTDENDSLSLVLPIGAFKLLECLYEYSNHQLAVLIGDKGYKDCDEFRGKKFPHIAIHGSLSFMVNLHSIKLFFSSLGGFSESSYCKDTFQLLFGYAFNKLSRSDFPNTIQHLSENLHDYPSDGLISLQKLCLEIQSVQFVPIKALISLLRYSHHDADVFYTFHREWINQTSTVFLGIRGEIDFQLDLDLVYQNWYKIKKNEDVPDILGHIAIKLGRLDQAIFFFKQNLIWSSDQINISTYGNIITCYKALGDLENAEKYLRDVLELSPTCTVSLDLKRQIEMSKKKITVGFIGCGERTLEEILPFMLSDDRFTCKVLLAQSDVVVNYLNHTISSHDNSNLFYISLLSQGFNKALSDSSIDAYIVDVSPSLFTYLINQLWLSKKHILSVSPLAFCTQNAKFIIDSFIRISKIMSNSENQLNKLPLVWHTLTPYTNEKAFIVGNQILSSRILGNPCSAVYCCANDLGLKHVYESNRYEDNLESLIIQMYSGILGLSFLLSSKLQAISISNAIIKNNSSNKSWPNLTAWVKLSNGVNANGKNGDKVVASCFCSRHSGDYTKQFQILCQGGILLLEEVKHYWVLKVISFTNAAINQEITYCKDSLSSDFISWLTEIHNFINNTQVDSSLLNIISPSENNNVDMISDIHNSIHTSVDEMCIYEAIVTCIQRGTCSIKLQNTNSLYNKS